MKKFIFVFLIVLSTVMISHAETGYKDVKPSYWAYSAIAALTDQGLIHGYPDGTLKPNDSISMAEFVKMAVVAATGKDIGGSTTGFWGYSYYDEAISLGYIKSDFYINRATLSMTGWSFVSREDAANIISMILGDLSIDDAAFQRAVIDVPQHAEYEDNIAKVYAAGIMSAYPDGTFRHRELLTRAQASMIIYRLVNKDVRLIPDYTDRINSTTLERVKGGSYETWAENLAETSTSTLPITDMINNLDDFPYTFRNTDHSITHYEIISDCPFPIIKSKNLVGDEVLDVLDVNDAGWGVCIISKGRMMLIWAGLAHVKPNGDTYKTLPDFDYVGLYDTSGRRSDTMILIPNPFK